MTEEVNEELDLSSQLAAAWDAAEESDDGEVSEPAGEPPETAWGADEHDEEVQPEGELSGVRDGEEQKPESPAPEVDALEAPPKGLDAAAREAWKEAPEAIKQHIAKFESRMDGLAQKYGESYQRVQAMDQVLAPYQQMFSVNGGAQQTIKGLLDAGAGLQFGNQMQKAQVAANIIKTFGVDITTLDGLLVGQVDPEVQKQSEMERMLNERIAPLQQKLMTYEQREQQMAQQTTQKIQTDLQRFAQENEFYSDVKAEMADLLDMAANRGRQMSLDEAYKIACSTNPQIQKIQQTRTSQQSMDRKRRAASSVRGTPSGTSSPEVGNDRLAALQAAWDNAGRM